MGELRLHALSIHEVRDMFGANAELAGRLRTIASDIFRVPAAENRPTGLLSKIGPLFRRGDDIVFPPEMPLPSDWEVLLKGSYVKPDRVEQSWKVVDAWLDAVDFGTFTSTYSSSELDGIDFALTKAGLPSQYGLRKLLSQDAQLPLMAGAGMRFGYSKNAHVLATATALDQVADQVEQPFAGAVANLRDFLDRFSDWTLEAATAGRPEPDLFVVWWEQGRQVVGVGADRR